MVGSVERGRGLVDAKVCSDERSAIVASSSLSWSNIVALEGSVTFTDCDPSIHHAGQLGRFSNRACPKEYVWLHENKVYLSFIGAAQICSDKSLHPVN